MQILLPTLTISHLRENLLKEQQKQWLITSTRGQPVALGFATIDTHHIWFWICHLRVLHRRLASKEATQSRRLWRKWHVSAGRTCQCSARTSLAPPTSVDEENLSDLSLPSPLFALFRLVPPQLVGHLNRDYRRLERKRRSTLAGRRAHRSCRDLGTASDPVDLGERPVEGVEEVQSAAGCPHPPLIPGLVRQTQAEAPGAPCAHVTTQIYSLTLKFIPQK